MELASRNDSQGFAARSRKNLLYIEEGYRSGHDVHVVTQILTSTLGLEVFPWEQEADKRIRGTRLTGLYEAGWPVWAETKPSKGLGQLIKNLRNAIAHCNVQFSSDDREARKVVVTFANENGEWQAAISAHDLSIFCLKFIELIQHATG